jgi:hypothetical protein
MVVLARMETEIELIEVSPPGYYVDLSSWEDVGCWDLPLTMELGDVHMG